MPYIREGRFGTGKVGKTYSIVSSYPKPMLVLVTEEGDMDGFIEAVKQGKLSKELEPKWLTAPEVLESCYRKPEELAKVSAVDLSLKGQLMTPNFIPHKDDKALGEFVLVGNYLITKGCPWATVVIAGVSGLNDLVIASIAKNNESSLANAQKWAPMAGGKVAQMIGTMKQLKAHFVCMFHQIVKEKETSEEVSVVPLVPSQVRDRMNSLFSQWFYACEVNGKRVVRTKAYGHVEGLGTRWPENLPDVCGPLYSDIYERKEGAK